jgi:hypothetical protein
MNSATSTSPPPSGTGAAGTTDADRGDEHAGERMQPWQLFAIAGLIGATIVVFLSRGQSSVAVILLSLTVFAAAAVGSTALRTLLPLAATGLSTLTTPIIGGRARAAIEREKALVLRSIKELEFDRAMGKVSEKDFGEMSARLRARAGRLMQRLDTGADYRAQIEQEIARRLGQRASAGTCASCGGANDPDARFCKGCGQRLASSLA